MNLPVALGSCHLTHGRQNVVLEQQGSTWFEFPNELILQGLQFLETAAHIASTQSAFTFTYMGQAVFEDSKLCATCQTRWTLKKERECVQVWRTVMSI